jgi:hypothetical protein
MASHAEATMSTGSTTTNRTIKIPAAFWAVVTLVLWSLAVTALIDRSPYGLDEATARAVLFLWSISDAVASPIVTLGIPDFRAVYLIPAGVAFPGSLLAAKLCALLAVLAVALGLFRWSRTSVDSESPLLATGLLLLSPLVLTAIDHVSIGPFLVLSFLLGALADKTYRASRIRFSGTYFAQMFLVIAGVSLHPAGLAYPLALLAGWLRSPPPEPAAPALIPGSERVHVILGIALATLAGALVAGAWPHQAWLGNPITALSQGIFSFQSESGLGDLLIWVLGGLLFLALIGTAWVARASLWSDTLLSSLVLCAFLAIACADATYVLVVLVLLLYWGFPVLLRVRIGGSPGFFGQRGVAFVLLVLLSTSFLSADRSRYERIRAGPPLSAQDQLLRAVAESVQKAAAAETQPGAVTEEQKARSGPRVASQWPGRTMIACRCSALPLPPASEDETLFLANLKGTQFVVFDPLDPSNRDLSRSFAMLGGARAETLALQPGGVLLQLHPHAQAPDPAPPLAPGIRG